MTAWDVTGAEARLRLRETGIKVKGRYLFTAVNRSTGQSRMEALGGPGCTSTG